MKKLFTAALVALAASFAIPQQTEACSRVLYTGSDSTLMIVGRSLDWKTPIPTNIYIYPRGIEKRSHSLEGAITWKSRYGAVYAVSYDGGVTEGMNEKGLVINGLFCKGTIYVNPSTEGRPPMSLAMFVPWMLDNYATTPEVVAALKKQDFTISGATFDGGTVSALHWGITDAEGRSAILEFHDGNVEIYEGDRIPMLTNDPQYPKMQAINDYWLSVGGVNFLPGGVRSTDRFVRGYFFDGHVDKTADPDLALSIVRSIMNNVSVPYQYTPEGEPNVSSTQWRSYSCIKSLRYYFDMANQLGTYYVDLNEVDLRPGQSVLKLTTSKAGDYVGNVTRKMEKTAPFTPMY